jgi:hypothetical protein
MPHTSAGPVQGVREYPGAAARRGAGAADGRCVRSGRCYKMMLFPPTGIEGIARRRGTFCDGIDVVNVLSGRAHSVKASPQAPRPR